MMDHHPSSPQVVHKTLRSQVTHHHLRQQQGEYSRQYTMWHHHYSMVHHRYTTLLHPRMNHHPLPRVVVLILNSVHPNEEDHGVDYQTHQCILWIPCTYFREVSYTINVTIKCYIRYPTSYFSSSLLIDFFAVSLCYILSSDRSIKVRKTKATANLVLDTYNLQAVEQTREWASLIRHVLS